MSGRVPFPRLYNYYALCCGPVHSNYLVTLYVTWAKRYEALKFGLLSNRVHTGINLGSTLASAAFVHYKPVTIQFKHNCQRYYFRTFTHIISDIYPLAVVVIEELHDVQQKEERLTQLTRRPVTQLLVTLSNAHG